MAETFSELSGVEIIREGCVTHFRPVDVPVKEQPAPDAAENCESSFFERLFGWLKRHNAKPYARVRDLADPTGERLNDPYDADVGSDGKAAVEIGVKLDF